jgi:hypothetical protein
MVPVKKPRRRRCGISTGIPTKATHPNHVWTWDFVHDTTMRGGKLRMLTVLDEYTRQSRCIQVDRKINARKVRSIMARSSSRRSYEHGSHPNRSRRSTLSWAAPGKMVTSRVSTLVCATNVSIERCFIR